MAKASDPNEAINLVVPLESMELSSNDLREVDSVLDPTNETNLKQIAELIVEFLQEGGFYRDAIEAALDTAQEDIEFAIKSPHVWTLKDGTVWQGGHKISAKKEQEAK